MQTNEINQAIAQNLRTLRNKHELSQDALGQLLGLGGEVIARIEYGKRELRVSELFQICAALEEPVDAFLPAYPHSEVVYDPGTAEAVSQEILTWMTKRDVRSIAMFARRLAFEADRLLKSSGTRRHGENVAIAPAEA